MILEGDARSGAESKFKEGESELELEDE